MRILITGANGMLGSDLTTEGQKQGYDVIALTHAELDITKASLIKEAYDTYQPQVVINCAAYTKVDEAEKNRYLALAVNALGVRNLALTCRENNAVFVQISTDYVFDGTKDKPWGIYDHPNPINTYGESKYLGECFLKTIGGNYFIVRTSWLFGSGGPNFVSTILRAALKQGELRVVNDQFGCPTYALDLACFLLKLVKTGAYGVYHVTNQGITNWYDFAKEIVKQAGINIPVLAVSSDEYTRPAKRPKNSALDPFPLKETVGILPPFWQDALSRFLSEALIKECLH